MLREAPGRDTADELSGQAEAPPPTAGGDPAAAAGVLPCGALPPGALAALLAGCGLRLVAVADGDPIPGSFWGEPEAGIVGREIYLRSDTPVHSALHEACHLICALREGRTGLDTDAGGTYAEEDAVCFLQIRLAAELAGCGAERMLADMDAWGYTFRLGSAEAWFAADAAEAEAWLAARRLLPGGAEFAPDAVGYAGRS